MPIIKTQRLLRLPPYLFGELNEVKLRLRQAGTDIIDLGMGNPDQPPAPHIIEKLNAVTIDPKVHRYSVSRGMPALLKAICRFYKRRFDVDLDWQSEAIATIGTKEGLAHLALALLDPGDLALVPNPTYPIHLYSVAMAGGNVMAIPLSEEREFVPELEHITREVWPRPGLITLNFPHNPTAACVDLDYFKDVIAFAKKNDIVVIHDLAYADITFDGYQAPSLLQVPGAKDIGVEFFSLSKSYNMPGWRVGFCVGNREVVEALAKIKGYYDYGIFTPVQVAAIAALDGPQDCVTEQARLYQSRRDVLCSGLNRIGWSVKPPKASMFLWAQIPEPYQDLGSIEFSKLLMTEAEVAVAPGIGFGHLGEGYVRIALVENEHRLRQAVRNIRRCLTKLQPDVSVEASIEL